MHIFGKGAGARGGDGGERGQSFNKSAVNGDKDFQQTVATVASDACRASRARRMRGALRCDLATVLLSTRLLSLDNTQTFMETFNFQTGGLYKPENCEPKNKVAIIIPFR